MISVLKTEYIYFIHIAHVGKIQMFIFKQSIEKSLKGNTFITLCVIVLRFLLVKR